PADHVAVHDLHVVDIEKQLHARRTDPANDAGHPVDVVALVARMALHGMRVVARIEVLQADGDAFFLGVSCDFLQSGYAVVRTFVRRNRPALGVVGIGPLVAGERNDGWNPRLGAGVDHGSHPGDYLFVVLRVVEALYEGRAWHAVGRQGADQPVLFQNRPVRRPDYLDGKQAEFSCDRAGFLDAPYFTRLVQPPDDARL